MRPTKIGIGWMGGHLRAIFWFYPHVGEDLEVDAFASKGLSHLSHGIQLIHGLVSNDAYSLRPEVLQVHADFLGHAGTKANR